jgi:DnaJ-class molecular chaperone
LTKEEAIEVVVREPEVTKQLALTKEEMVEVLLLGPEPRPCGRCAGSGWWVHRECCEACDGTGQSPHYRRWKRAQLQLAYGYWEATEMTTRKS